MACSSSRDSALTGASARTSAHLHLKTGSAVVFPLSFRPHIPRLREHVAMRPPISAVVADLQNPGTIVVALRAVDSPPMVMVLGDLLQVGLKQASRCTRSIRLRAAGIE